MHVRVGLVNRISRLLVSDELEFLKVITIRAVFGNKDNAACHADFPVPTGFISCRPEVCTPELGVLPNGLASLVVAVKPRVIRPLQQRFLSLAPIDDRCFPVLCTRRSFQLRQTT